MLGERTRTNPRRREEETSVSRETQIVNWCLLFDKHSNELASLDVVQVEL